MSDDYLWDRSGKDDEVEKLEKLLRPLALRPTAPPPVPGAPASAPSARPATGPGRWPFVVVALLSVAAASVAALSLRGARDEQEKPAPFVKQDPSPTPEAPPVLEVREGDGQFVVAKGNSIATTGSATFVLRGVGTLMAEPNAQLRVIALRDDLQKVRLERGTLHARIGLNVRPRLVQVETPATTCVDLGCHYTLSVDDDGCSLVHVTTGRVAFVEGTREVFVPARAHCRAAPRRGSGTPLWDDSPAELVAAIRAFDDAAAADRVTTARAVVERATRDKDSLPLWHFLQDADAAIVAIGYEALTSLDSVPLGVTREATLARSPAALAAWKDHLARNWD